MEVEVRESERREKKGRTIRQESTTTITVADSTNKSSKWESTNQEPEITDRQQQQTMIFPLAVAAPPSTAEIQIGSEAVGSDEMQAIGKVPPTAISTKKDPLVTTSGSAATTAAKAKTTAECKPPPSKPQEAVVGEHPPNGGESMWFPSSSLRQKMQKAAMTAEVEGSVRKMEEAQDEVAIIEQLPSEPPHHEIRSLGERKVAAKHNATAGSVRKQRTLGFHCLMGQAQCKGKVGSNTLGPIQLHGDSKGFLKAQGVDSNLGWNNGLYLGLTAFSGSTFEQWDPGGR